MTKTMSRTPAQRGILFVMATEHEYREHLRARMEPLITGVGPVEAAIGKTVRLEQLRVAKALPDLVISLGSAGSRRCALGEVYQIESVSWRDMDATAIGFPPGVTPFADHPARTVLPTPLTDVPRATLSTGSDIVVGEGYAAIDADLVDMETFAVLRACQRFGVPWRLSDRVIGGVIAATVISPRANKISRRIPLPLTITTAISTTNLNETVTLPAARPMINKRFGNYRSPYFAARRRGDVGNASVAMNSMTAAPLGVVGVTMSKWLAFGGASTFNGSPAARAAAM